MHSSALFWYVSVRVFPPVEEQLVSCCTDAVVHLKGPWCGVVAHPLHTQNAQPRAPGLAVSHDSSLLVSISHDKSVKVFDVASFDMMAMLRLPFVPACAEWIFKARPALCLPVCCSLTFLESSGSGHSFTQLLPFTT